MCLLPFSSPNKSLLTHLFVRLKLHVHPVGLVNVVVCKMKARIRNRGFISMAEVTSSASKIGWLTPEQWGPSPRPIGTAATETTGSTGPRLLFV